MTAEENGALPAGWDVKTIESLADPGGIAYGVLKPGPNIADGVPMLRVSDIRDGRVDSSAIYRIEPSLDEQYKRTKLHGGEVVLSIQGSVGRAAVVPKSLAGANISRTLAMIRLEEPRLARWVHRALESPQVQAAMRRAVGGTTRDSLNLRDLRKVVIPLAGAQERDRVLKQLDDVDARRASIADRLAAARVIVNRLRAAVLASACSGRLTADWRSVNSLQGVRQGPPLSVQAQRHGRGAENSYNFTDIPESWGWWSVESITSTVIDYRGRTPPTSDNGTIPHVRTTQLRDGRIDWNVDRFVAAETYDTYMTRGLPERGDVLFTMEAPLGEVGVVDVDSPFSIAQRILLLRPGDGLTGDYLALALRSPAVRRAIELRSTGSGVSGVAYKRLRSVLIPKPPLEEQVEIVRRAHAALKTAGELTIALSGACDALERSVRAAAAMAFRGEFAVADSPG